LSTLERDAFRTSTDFDFFDELDLDEPDWEEPVFELDLDELDLDELDVEDFVDPDELGVEVLLFDDPDVLDPEDLLEVVGFSVVVGALPDFEPDDPLPWACAPGARETIATTTTAATTVAREESEVKLKIRRCGRGAPGGRRRRGFPRRVGPPFSAPDRSMWWIMSVPHRRDGDLIQGFVAHDIENGPSDPAKRLW